MEERVETARCEEVTKEGAVGVISTKERDLIQLAMTTKGL